ncbi:hypothetical protein [Oleiphilus sp. HI0117]|uniref:hypothetical protein n=2 Tax=unclassified Oleiphilus TaxID=2631174 RepID=UPI0007C3090A|nr:hypothetical protein [Oleiphilus sp. HI0117]KZZ35729.1 hypothetical protein A3757_02605 [Oleiphilus sp. HI0117]
MKIEWEVEENDDLFPSIKLFYCLFKPKGYKTKVKHYLKFGQENLSYHKQDSIIWHISYKRLARLETPKAYAPVSLFNNSFSVFIHTNDNDQYAFECTLTEKELKKVKIEIEQRTKNV